MEQHSAELNALTKDEIDKFKDLVNQDGYSNVAFKKAKLKDYEYGLDFETI